MRDILRMQVVAYFGILLCLVASTHAKSVRGTEGETDTVERNQRQRGPDTQADEKAGFCNPDPCQNGALCLRLKERCSCPSGYSGVHCEKCQCENGFCEKDDKGIDVCKCPPEWGVSMGNKQTPTKCKQCECGKDSNCTFEVSWFFSETKTCLCKVGYEDKNGACKGTCKENPCQNGGMCFVKGADIECRCKTPFLGDLCEKKDICSPNPCQNGGICNVTEGEVTCQCTDRFIGTNCTIDICSPNPCQNGGICNATEGEVTCQCTDRFIGTNCTIEISFPSTTTSIGTENTTSADNSTGVSGGRTRNPLTSLYTEPSTVKEISKTTSRIKANVTTSFPILSTEKFSLNFTGETRSTIQTTTPTHSTSIDLCAVNPCKNGGICRMEGYEARCYCTSPFSGKLCEKGLCLWNPCMNGGLCKIVGTSFQCECSFPYSGRFCEKDPCSGNPCRNGGTCFVAGNGFKCLCKAPYAGILCETDPCVWNPCKNGGICKTEYEAVRCFCKEPFTGEFCDSRSKIDVHTIASFAVVSILLVIILILVSCILCQRYYAVKTS